MTPKDESDLRAAAQAVLDQSFMTYRARNGRQVSVEADDGEACVIVHSDAIDELRKALATPPSDHIASPEGAREHLVITLVAAGSEAKDALLNGECRVPKRHHEYNAECICGHPGAALLIELGLAYRNDRYPQVGIFLTGVGSTLKERLA